MVGESGILGKLYKDPKDLPDYRDKIEAMLAARPNLPPFPYNGKTYVQMAWPLGTITNGHGDFLGFVMPEVDIQASTVLENILQKATRKWKGIPEFYGARVLLAANLAALMVELHGLDHHMVDMKPINMRFYPDVWYMAILDTDGFSINGQRRFPAQQFSDEYIAPEARGNSPEMLGLGQDLFALAIIIFRLINNGLHPFQGVDLRPNHPTTLQERIFAGLYTYGMSPHSDVHPAPSSIHDFLEHETRQLFDRAFLSRAGRPTAIEWRDHLGNLLNNKALVQCKASKEHAHFSKGCGLCAVAKSSRPLLPPPQGAGTTQWSPHVITNLQLGPGLDWTTLVIVWLKDKLKIVAGAIGALVVLTLWIIAPSQPIPPPPRPTPPPEPIPTHNLNSLRAYVNGCQICSYKSAALDEIRKLERDQLANEEAIAYQAARGDIAKLRAYASSRQICAFRPEAPAETRNLEATARYFSFEVCNSTSYGAEIAVVGRNNPDSDVWIVSGWWTVSSNSCIPIGGFAKGKFYSMATVHGELGGWYGGDTKQCVEFPGPFETVVRADSSCGTNSKIVGFQEFNVTGNSFTWRLTGEPSWQTGEIEAAAQWNLNGSKATLIVNGSHLEFIYTNPREGLREVGVLPGTKVFDGTVSDGMCQGTAYVFSKTCGAFGFQVSGYVSSDQRRITLTGQAPYVNAQCQIDSYHDAVDDFIRDEK